MLKNSPQQFNNSGTELKFRKSNSFLANLSFSARKGVISSQDDLKKYLDDQEERTEHRNELIQSEKRFSSVVDSSSPQVHNSPNMTGQQLADNTFNSPYSSKSQSFQGSPFKSNFSPFSSPHQMNSHEQKSNDSELLQASMPVYQPAIKVSTIPCSPEKSESINYSHSSTKVLEKVLLKLDIDDSRLNQMVENIRKWISQTILGRLAEEIDSINKLISEKGFIDSLIGGIVFYKRNYFIC